MALTPRRHRFGASSADVAMSPDADNYAKFEPTAILWVYSTKVGGTRLTDLQNDGGGTITQLVTDEFGQVPEFYGPEGFTEVWVAGAAGDDPASNPRALLVASDLATDIQQLDATLDNVVVNAGVQTVNGLPPVEGNVVISPSDLEPAAATATDLASVLAYAGAVVEQVGGGYPAVPTGAKFAIFIGSADPGSAADAQPSIWLQPETA